MTPANAPARILFRTGTNFFSSSLIFLAQVIPEKAADKQLENAGTSTKIEANAPPMRSGGTSLIEIPHAINTEEKEQKSGFQIKIAHGKSMDRVRSFEINPASRYASVELV